MFSLSSPPSLNHDWISFSDHHHQDDHHEHENTTTATTSRSSNSILLLLLVILLILSILSILSILIHPVHSDPLNLIMRLGDFSPSTHGEVCLLVTWVFSSWWLHSRLCRHFFPRHYLYLFVPFLPGLPFLCPSLPPAKFLFWFAHVCNGFVGDCCCQVTPAMVVWSCDTIQGRGDNESISGWAQNETSPNGVQRCTLMDNIGQQCLLNTLDCSNWFVGVWWVWCAWFRPKASTRGRTATLHTSRAAFSGGTGRVLGSWRANTWRLHQMHESLRLRFLEAGQSIATCNCMLFRSKLNTRRGFLQSCFAACKFHVV